MVDSVEKAATQPLAHIAELAKMIDDLGGDAYLKHVYVKEDHPMYPQLKELYDEGNI